MLPHGSHITRKRGVYYYRRRLPGGVDGEVALSLSTRAFREAEHLAAIADAVFNEAWERAVQNTDEGSKIATILRGYLQRAVNADLKARLYRPAGRPVYAWWWEPGESDLTAAQADLREIRERRADLSRQIAHNLNDGFLEEHAEELAAQHGLSPDMVRRLVVGMQEAQVRSWDVAEARALGVAPLVLVDEQPEPAAPPPLPAPPTPQAPLFSAMVEPFFKRREGTDRATHQVMGQERGTLRRFIEICGDRPVDSYRRGDVTNFLDTLRRLPKTYGKSPTDRDRSVAEIIATADAMDAPRLADKTIKRHLSALSQLFQFTVDIGHLTVSARTELVENHRFRTESKARSQRDQWTTEDLAALFNSPAWRGHHPHFRSKPGTEIVRDAKFWLPILALHHGARLEEFADLYRRDVGREAGQWFVKITEAEGRRLKTDNAERVIPLHPELIRLGFLDYVKAIAPNAADPLFPDIEPQGKDRKRGPRITRWFVEYRRNIGIYRAGVGMHAFRHTAITRLRNAITTAAEDRHVDFLMGHADSGGEGHRRYDKGPGLKVAGDTLGLLRFPEIDLSHLYPRDDD